LEGEVIVVVDARWDGGDDDDDARVG